MSTTEHEKVQAMLDKLKNDVRYSKRDTLEHIKQKYSATWFKSLSWPVKLFIIVGVILIIILIVITYYVFNKLEMSNKIRILISIAITTVIIILDINNYI